MKKVLMICYAFPPLGGSGVQRSLKFSKYLPQDGWVPIVLTGDGSYGGYPQERDLTLLSEFPREGHIVRAKCLNPLFMYRKYLLRPATDGDATVGTAARQRRPAKLWQRWAKALKESYHRWVCIPDTYAPWFPFAFLAGLRAVGTHAIDLVFSTSDPYTDHMLGYAIGRLAGKPWVADFRDPWTSDPDYEYSHSLRGRIDRRLERLFVENAAGTTVVYDEMRRQMIEMYQVSPERVAVITNGFDEEDFRPSPHPCTDKFTLAYVGRFAGANHASPKFLKALRELLNENPDMDMRVVFVGHFGRDNERLVEELNLAGTVRRLGYLPHSEAVQHMLRSDALLLTLTSGQENDPRPTGKVFEYLAARRPILAIVPLNGLAAEIVRKTRSGVTVGPTDIPGMKRALRRMYEQHQAGTMRLHADSQIDGYSRARLAAKLAAFFEQCLTG